MRLRSGILVDNSRGGQSKELAKVLKEQRVDENLMGKTELDVRIFADHMPPQIIRDCTLLLLPWEQMTALRSSFDGGPESDNRDCRG